MEDVVSRMHAQQLVAAALYVGSRAVGQVLQRALEQPNRIELHAPSVPGNAANASRLQALAAQAARRALGDTPAAVVAVPHPRDGWHVHVALAGERPVLQEWERRAVQDAWEHGLRREFGRLAAPPARDAGPARAMGHALQEARPRHQDQLDFRVRLDGARGPTLLDLDRAVRDIFARAAGVDDATRLAVRLRPRGRGEAWQAQVMFNRRDTPERGPQHLDPAALGARVVAGAPSVPAVEVASWPAGTVARVGVAAVEVARARSTPDRDAPELDPPAALRQANGPERTLVN
jgi:hypothetical protein